MQCGSDGGQAKLIKNEIRSLKKRLQHSSLKKYQEDWIQQQRDSKVLTRGKLQPSGFQGERHILILILPERKRIAEPIQLNELTEL
jgi:hypothetical protein